MQGSHSHHAHHLAITLIMAIWLVPAPGARAEMSLSFAWERGLVAAIIQGTGSSSGDSLLITVRRTQKTPSGPLELSVEPGLYLRPNRGDMQSMVVSGVRGKKIDDRRFIPSETILVPEEGQATYILEAYCAAFLKHNPSPATTFTLAPPDPRLACILKTGKAIGLAMTPLQAAVWMMTDNVDYRIMKEIFPVTENDWAQARKLLALCGEVNGPRAPPPPPTTARPPPVRNIPIENLTGEILRLEMEGPHAEQLGLWPGQKIECPLPNGTYTFNIRYGEAPSVYRNVTMTAVVNDSTTFIRLKPPTGKLARPANAPPPPPRKILKSTPWREVSADGNSIRYTKPLDKTFTVSDCTFVHSCLDGCKISSVSIHGSDERMEVARVTAFTPNGRSFEAGEAVHIRDDQVGEGSIFRNPEHKPSLLMPNDKVVTKVSVQVTGSATVVVHSVDMDRDAIVTP